MVSPLSSLLGLAASTPRTEPALLTVARQLADLGFVPFWLDAPDAQVKDSGKQPTVAFSKISWAPGSSVPWPPRAGCNLAIRAGVCAGAPLAVAIIDIDSAEAMTWATANLPPTPVRTATGKGEHWYYRLPEGQTVRNKVKFAPADGTLLDLDVRGHNGYVVAPGSTHWTGRSYTMVGGSGPEGAWAPADIAALPDFPFALLRECAKRPGKNDVPAQERLTRPWSEDEISEALEGWLARTTNPPEGWAEAARAALDGTSYAPSGSGRNAARVALSSVVAVACPGIEAEDFLTFTALTTHATETVDKDQSRLLDAFRGWTHDAGHVLENNAAVRAAGAGDITVGMKARLANKAANDAQAANDARHLSVGIKGASQVYTLNQAGFYHYVGTEDQFVRSFETPDCLGWAVAQGLATTWTANAKGQPKRKTPQALLTEYTTMITPGSLSYAYDRAACTFDPGRTPVEGDPGRAPSLVVSECEYKITEPCESPECARWLELLTSTEEEHQLLLDWVASAPDAKKRLPLLVLLGAPDTGKTTLAKGLAMVWSGRFTDIKEIQGDRRFAPALKTSPVILADEVFPDVLEGVNRVDWIKTTITADTRAVEDKNVKSVLVRGQVRVIHTSNHGNLDFPVMDTDSQKAMAQRLVVCHAREEAATYMTGLPDEIYNYLTKEGGIAAHALWLNKTRTVKRATKLDMAGNGLEFVLRSVASTGLVRHVLSVIVGLLSGTLGFPMGDSRKLFTPTPKGLWVGSGFFAGSKATWDILGNGKPYSASLTGEIGQALKSLATKNARNTRAGKDVRESLIPWDRIRSVGVVMGAWEADWRHPEEPLPEPPPPTNRPRAKGTPVEDDMISPVLEQALADTASRTSKLLGLAPAPEQYAVLPQAETPAEAEPSQAPEPAPAPAPHPVTHTLRDQIVAEGKPVTAATVVSAAKARAAAKAAEKAAKAEEKAAKVQTKTEAAKRIAMEKAAEKAAAKAEKEAQAQAQAQAKVEARAAAKAAQLPKAMRPLPERPASYYTPAPTVVPGWLQMLEQNLPETETETRALLREPLAALMASASDEPAPYRRATAGLRAYCRALQSGQGRLQALRAADDAAFDRAPVIEGTLGSDSPDNHTAPSNPEVIS